MAHIDKIFKLLSMNHKTWKKSKKIPKQQFHIKNFPKNAPEVKLRQAILNR